MSEAGAAQRTGQFVALAAALATCRPYVVRYLRGLGASVEDAEDLAQDALLVALRSLPTFRGDAQLSTWLCRIAQRNFAHTRAQASPCVSLPKEEEVPIVEGFEEGVLERISLCEGLSHLPEPLQLLVCMHYLQGYSYRDICDGKGITKSQLTNELSAARRILRKYCVLPSH